jgi:hypothetical protein
MAEYFKMVFHNLLLELIVAVWGFELLEIFHFKVVQPFIDQVGL